MFWPERANVNKGRTTERDEEALLTKMDAIYGRDVDVGHALASREALDELYDRLIQGVEPGWSDRFDQAVALAAVEGQQT